MDKNRILNISFIAGIVLLTAGSMIAFVKSAFDPVSIALMSIGGIMSVVYAVIKRDTLKQVFTSSRTRYGINSVIYTLLVLGIIFIVQAIFTVHAKQLDLTKAQKYVLAEQTKNILKSLDTDINAYYFYSANTRNMKVEDLLKRYEKMSPKFRFEAIDADKSPAFAKRLNVSHYGVVVLERKDKGTTEKIDTPAEESVTNGLIRLVRDTVKKIYFSTGHGEPSTEAPQGEKNGISILKKQMEEENYAVFESEFFKMEKIPEDAALVVIAGARADLFDTEVKMLEDYLAGGGKLLILYGNYSGGVNIKLPNLERLMIKRGIHAREDIVVDKMARIFGGDFLMPIISQYEQHDITKAFRVASFFPLTRTFEIKTNVLGVKTQALAMTSASSWGETNTAMLKKGKVSLDDKDHKGPLPVAAVAEIEKGGGAMAVFGSWEFAGNAYIATSGNRDFIMNTVSYLAEEGDSIAIRAKENSFEPLFMSKLHGRMLFIVPTIFFPLLILAAGILVFVRRKMS